MSELPVMDRTAMKDPSTAHCRIYVGNLSPQVTEEILFETFKQYGKVLGIALNRGFGFIQFEEESSVNEAITKIHKTIFHGRNIVVRTAQTNAANLNKDQQQPTPEPQKPPPVHEEQVIDMDKESFIDQDNQYEQWEDRGMNMRGHGRGMRRGAPRGRPGFRERSPIGREWGDRGYDRFPAEIQPYPPRGPMPERNDCEIIVVSKLLTEYAEYIESRLKRLGLVVDLLFPMEDVPIGKVLGNIASRGCLYAILVMPENLDRRSLTLTMLHGLPQEHRNMPLEDALQLISRNFMERSRGGGGREAMLALLGQLADGGTLTVLQFDRVIQYLQEKREQQVKIELGAAADDTKDQTQVDLQQRIMSILNSDSIVGAKKPPPVQLPAQQTGAPKLLADPTVQKALDSLLQKFK